MAVKIRLARAGAKKRPYYHIVAADCDSPRDGKFIEAFGAYEPKSATSPLKIDQERLGYWLKVGAQPTETVGHLIKESKKAAAAKA